MSAISETSQNVSGEPSIEPCVEPRVVQLILDTNIWLDWFVFAQEPDSAISQLKSCVMHGVQLGATEDSVEYRVLMTQPMWDEWVDVLGRAQFKVESQRQGQILAQTRALVTWVDLRSAPPSYAPIRCSDRDDQVFIDVALAYRVDWLISKDRHLLKLRSRALKQGVRVVTPEAWWQYDALAGAGAHGE